MNIWLSTIGQRLDHAENTRTMLLAATLLKRGHAVTLWTSAYDHIRKQWRDEWSNGDAESWNMPSGLSVRFMKGCGYRSNIGPNRLVDHILAARDFRRRAAELPSPDIAIASLPDHVTAAAMVDYGQVAGFPVIVDVRDKWPDIFVDYAPAPLKPFVRIGLARESARARNALANAEALVAMMQSMLDWGLAKAKRAVTEDDRIFYLATMEANSPHQSPISDLTPELQQLLSDVRGQMVFSFIGTFNKTQHPSLILDALELLAGQKDFDPSSIAVMIGGDGVDADAVRDRIGLLPFAHYLGWMHPPEMRALLARTDVGLLPMNFASEAFNNKAFAYLASGLPILNCADGDLARLISTADIGINLPAGDPHAMAEAIMELASSPTRVEELKARARAVFDSEFDQRKIYDDYADHIEGIARRGRTKR
jgi:glycosyltransferase involved in cell wall biosynthesis